MDWLNPVAVPFLAWLLAFLPTVMNWHRAASLAKRIAWGAMVVASLGLTFWLISEGIEKRQAEEWRQARDDEEKKSATERRNKAKMVRQRIDQFLEESDGLRDEMYPLCRARNYLKYEAKVEKTWREPVIRYLSEALGQSAADDFQRVSYQYEHRECGEIEWTQKWLAELVKNLRRVRDGAERYVP